MQKTKKTLNLIALIVFLMSNFLTPISYAVDDLDAYNNPGSELMTDQDGNSEQNENGVESELNGVEDVNNNPGSESKTDQDGNSGQNENEVESGLNGEETANNNPGSESMTDQEGNSEQNEDVVEPGLNGEEDTSEGQGDEQAKTDTNNTSVLDYLFHEGDILTPSPFLGTGEDSLEQNLSGDAKNLSGENLSGDVELLTGEVQELTGTALELSIARETLNETPITGTSEGKGVTVNVEAPAGTFPDGAKLRILPITVKKELNEIKQQIIDSDESDSIVEDSEIVAFDISFIYTLSDGTEIELQPKNGEGVKVSFNYEENKSLSDAGESEEQEVKVFHIDDKNEEGEKVAQGEEVVKEVKIDEEATTQGEVVVDAESFSVYAVLVTASSYTITYNLNGGYWTENKSTASKTVTYTNGKTSEKRKTPSKAKGTCDGKNCMFIGWYTAATGGTRWTGNPSALTNNTAYAHWLPFEDKTITVGSEEIVIMDRNIGATTSDRTLEGSYGYHFQRGNNYGFDHNANDTAFPNGESTDSTQVESTDWQDYVGNNASTYYSSKWITTNPWNAGGDGSNDWLWGTADDEASMQGPCPGGYHVPTQAEWAKFSGAGLDYNYAMNTMNLPFAGNRRYSNFRVSLRGDYGVYWSSTPYGNRLARSMYFYDGYINWQNNSNRSYGNSVRCFKNFSTPKTLTFNVSENGGTSTAPSSQEYDEGETVTLPACTATKSGYECIGWNTNKDATTALSTVTLDDDKTVYAIFKKTVTVTFSQGNGVYSVTPPASTSCIAWNTATTCSVSPATATCNAGYRSPTWSASTSNLSSSITTTASCTACTAGTYTTAGNTATICTDCEAGYYCPAGSAKVACTTLGTNYTHSAAKSTSATACYMDVAAGSYKTSANGNETTGCGAGKYSTSHTSNYGSVDNSCTNIEAGCYGSSASSSCPAQCQGRTKYSAAGKSECSTVSAGYYTTGCGSDGNKCTGQSQCTAGTSCSNGVQSSCVASTNTTAGTYSSSNGATSCTTASDGNYVATAGASGQTECTVGNYCKDGKIIACPTGYTSDKGAKAQTECYITVSAGKKKESATASTTTNCGAGKYSTEHKSYYNSADNSCTNIEAGCYGSSASSSCPAMCVASSSTVPGTYSTAGASECLVVSDGYYVVSDRATSQTECPAGSYCEGGLINSCPDGYTSNTGSTTENQCYKALTVTFTIQDTNAATKSGGSTGCNLYYGLSNCSITSPTLTANAGYTALGWNTNSGATSSSLNSNSSTAISGDTVYYSITKSNDKVLHITYTKGTGVEEIGKTSDSCTLTGTYNGAQQATSCTVVAPSITPKSGYENEIWTESGTNNTVQELETITLTEDLHLTASAEYEASSTAYMYNIEYVLNGDGYITGQKTKYTVEDTFTLVEPTWTGYEFIGWTGSNGDIPQTGVVIPVGTTGDLTYYANWESVCSDGEEYVESKGKCYPSRAIIRDSITNEIIQINDQEWDDLNIYFLMSGGTTGYYTMMDRNMGATEVYNQNFSNQNIASYGYYYKWGNNYGFTGGDSSFASASYGTQNDWGQGPCPEGYHVLTSGDWNNLYTNWNSSNTVINNKGEQWASDLLLSFAGRWTSRIYSGTDGYYWSSSRGNGPLTMNFYQNSIISGLLRFSSDEGHSVRCLKDSPNSQTLTLHANGGSKAVIAFTGTVGNGKFTALGTPTRSNSTFSGWYDAEVGGNKLEKGSAVVSDIYARWSCDSGYIDLGDGNGCVKSEATLLPGPQFNSIIKAKANSTTSYSTTASDYKIKTIVRSSNPAEDAVTISVNDDALAVKAWFENDTLYYYSLADVIYMNEDSSYMFQYIDNLETLDLTEFNTSRVKNMSYMFRYLRKLSNLNLSNFDTSNVTNMSFMFYNCDGLTNLDLSNFDTSNVTNMSNMFQYCKGLTDLNLSSFNTSNVTNMKSMFDTCERLTGLNLSNFDTSSVTNMSNMFLWSTGLINLDLSSFVTSGVTTMENMFQSCLSLETLDLSSFDTSNVTNMGGIFYNCGNLKTVYASGNFVTTNLSNDWGMFYATSRLVGGNGLKHDSTKITRTYAQIDNENQTGYFTDPSHFAIRFRNLSGDEIATQWISTGGTATPLSKSYASFSYYTDSDATTPYDFTTKLYAYSEVYADMSCDDGYTEVNGECVQQFTVEFEAYTNGGLVNMSGNLVASGSIKVASGTEINLSDYVAVNDPTSYIGDGWLFDGWGTIPERIFKIETPTLVITGDITLHALFYKIYESYFELQDINAGTLSSNTGYCTGYNGETSCDLIIPTFTENDGYIFDGFSDSQGSTGTIDFYTIGNTYYTVTHETAPISIIFNVNGNSGTTETRECYKYNGSDICLIKSPDITPAIGFTKIGWSTDAGTHTNEWNVNTLSGVSANSTYYAQSKKDKVTLNISYGTGVGVSSISKISDSCDLEEVWNGAPQATGCTVILPEITLKSGYGTGVWTKNTNPSVTKNPGDDIELTSNDSYTASATVTVYPITYHENGGILIGQKTSYTVEEDFTLVTPNRDSYVFEGWTGSNGDNPQKTVTVNSGTVTGPLSYYANWTPITYTISFSGNATDVVGTQGSIDATYDSGDTAPESNFTRPGYTFISWNTQSDGNGTNYNTGSELINLATTSGDVVTLYAVWQANTDTPYTVHYYLENVDDENYTFDSTDGKAGTTDDEIFIDTLKKEITGAHFEKAAVVVSNQGPEYGATTTVDNITVSGDGNTEVYLFYKRNTHTVTATAGEGVGSVSGAGTYKYGQTVTLTPGNINSCYTASSKTFTMPDNDVQETLSGVIKKFTVTLNKDSHISSVQGAGEYNCGVEVNVSATPNVGYEFVRWEKNSTQVSAQSSYTFTITESVVLNAVSKAQNGITYTVRHWIRDIGANTYTKYSEESKSGETDSPITLENEKISVPCGTYAEGKENGTVKTTTIIKGDGSTVIDLYYSRNSYTVTTSKDSGIQSISNSASHECGAGVTVTATPKTGYSFARWNSEDVASSTSNPYTFTMPDKAVSIQAQSNANTYAVNFNANGGTGTMSQQTFTYDISQQLSDNLFTRTGYIFTGWSIDSGATVPTYTNKQSVDNLATTGSITLYAIWTTKGTSTKYTVRHIKQGLSTPTDDVVETQELYAETNSVQTPAVNIYSGFNSPSAGNITVSANGNASIDYVYTRKDITLTLDNNNGTQNSTITGKYGANVQKPTSNPQKTGYTFTGWLPNIPDAFPAISGTYVAQYALDTYTITYSMNGGINHADNPTSYTYLSGDITLKSPSRDGYVFSGWLGTDVNSVTKTVIIPTHSEGNRNYIAIWGEDKNHDGIDDDSEPKYTVTINYVYSRGGIVAGAYITGNQLSGFTYNVDSPVIVNYHADKTNVSGTITGNVNETVTYTPDHDTNNNGIADEEEPASNSGGSSSGGGGGGGGKKTETSDTHGSANDKDSSETDEGKDRESPLKDGNSEGVDSSDVSPKNENNGTRPNNSTLNTASSTNVKSNNPKYTEEFNQAYDFAYSNGITTTKSIEQAKMNTPLTRIAMAKMLSNFAINVLGEEPDTSKGIIKFNDVSNKLDRQYDNAVTKAYQLGIMGQNMKNNNFRPNDEVTRAEFATALSRLLYNTEEGKYKSTGKYYEPHIAKLYKEGIISKTDPEMKEKRGYVMLMLMRSVQ